MDWLRWHHGSVTDPKFQLVARKTGAGLPTVITVWAYLLEAASQSVSRGDFGSVDCEAVDCLLGLDDGVTERVIQALRDRGLVAGTQIASWDKRQSVREREDTTAAERKRRQRERETNNQVLTSDEGEMSRHVTPCHTTSHHVTPRGEEIRVDKKDQDPIALLRNACVASDTQPSESVCEEPAKRPKGKGKGKSFPALRFDDFWAEYPRGERRLHALRAWRNKNLDPIADAIIADVRKRRERHRQWLDGFVPHAATYLNGERWNDPIAESPHRASKTLSALQTLQDMKHGPLAEIRNPGRAEQAALPELGTYARAGLDRGDGDDMGGGFD